MDTLKCMASLKVKLTHVQSKYSTHVQSKAKSVLYIQCGKWIDNRCAGVKWVNVWNVTSFCIGSGFLYG